LIFTFIYSLKAEGARKGTRSPDPSFKRIANYTHRFFPPKEVNGVGIFQDAGPLENDPANSALLMAADMFPLVEEPDFIVSLGTGTPRTKESSSIPTSSRLRLWKD